MPTKYPRLNLLVPAAIAQRLDQESDFLHLRSRVVMNDGAELKSKADLIRWAANLYIEACEAGHGATYDYDETEVVPFTLDSTTKGRWEYAVKYRFADSYHQLASYALCWYFDRIDQQVEKDAQMLRFMQSMGSLQVLGYLRRGEYAQL